MTNKSTPIDALKRVVFPAGLSVPILLGALALFVAGCDSKDGPRVIHETEIKPRMGGGGMPMDATHGFAAGQGGDQPMMPSMGAPTGSPMGQDMGAPMGQSMGSPQGESPEVEFDAPEGWVFVPGSGMRLATFKIKDAEGEKEATVVALPSTPDAYGVNVRRWLGQLGMDLPGPRLESFIAKREAFSTVQKISGALFDFTQLQDVPDKGKGFMLAAMIDAGGRTLFVKLTGGIPFLRKNKQKFLALSKSIRVKAGEAPDGAASGGEAPGGDIQAGANATEAPAGSASGSPMGTGMGQAPTMQANDPAFSQVPNGVSRLTWQTPTGWKSLGAKGMRTGSFAVTYAGKTADGSIVQLPGSAGGVESNVRRWMEQVGLTQLDDKAMRAFLESQQRIRTKDGFDGTLINLAAVLNGNLTQENSILAVLIQGRNETIFVKLTGPRSVLLRNVDALAKLSSSLAVAN